jgi:RNA recognition motif-containing protein
MDRELEEVLPTRKLGVREMGNRLYVGNLPFSVDESALRSLFEQNERTVEEVKLITDRMTGRPRGFGFIEMSNSEDADKAIRELNGYEMDGRSLKVNEARERNDHGRRF